jgi:peptide-methionine (R)-S-oxide reductase
MKVNKTQQEWKAQLDEQTFYVCRQNGTEAPFSGKYYDCKDDGVYRCVCCHAPLFDSNTKFDSKTGWPSFYEALEDSVVEIKDISHGMVRTEVRCATCDAHLGHVFEDGVEPTGLRYSINSVCLDLDEER